MTRSRRPIELETPPLPMVIVSLPTSRYQLVLAKLVNLASPDGFVSLTRDVAEITLILGEHEWEELAGSFPEAQVTSGRRLIRFATVLDFSVVGFMAEVARLLAAADISLLAISTWQTDALLVEARHLTTAVEILKSSEKLAAIIDRE
jgi:hypothetical protein